MDKNVAVAFSVTNRCSLCGRWFESDTAEQVCPICKPNKEVFIDSDYLRNNPGDIFVFGDNYLRRGHGGAAALRDEPNTYGFITKIAPTHRDEDYFRPEEYVQVYCSEINRLIDEIRRRPAHTFLISKLGAGIANRYHIFETIIEPTIRHLLDPYSNVRFLW